MPDPDPNRSDLIMNTNTCSEWSHSNPASRIGKLSFILADLLVVFLLYRIYTLWKDPRDEPWKFE